MKQNLKQNPYKNNRLQQIRGFVNVVQCKTTVKASEKMGLTQSSISNQIASLERDLGMKLFVRSGNFLELTENGRKFYEIAMPSLQNIDNLYQHFLSSTQEKTKKEVKIAGHHAAMSLLFPKILQKINSEDEEITMHYSHISFQEACSSILDEKIDIAIFPCEDNTTFNTGLVAKKILNYNISILFSQNNPLAQKNDNDVSLNDILQQKLIHEDVRLMTSSHIMNVFKQHYSTKLICNNMNWEIMYNLVKHSLGCCGFDDVYLQSKPWKKDGLAKKSISHLLPPMSYFVIYKNQLHIKSSVQKIVNSFVK